MTIASSQTKRPIRIEGEVAYIQLTRGYEAVIDAADVPLVNSFNWHATVIGRSVYAGRTERLLDGKRVTVLLHRFIMAAPDSLQVDHRNGDGLDNQRVNLRLATRAQNNRNRRMNATSTSGVKGVRWHKRRGKWFAAITLDGKQRHLGYFLNTAEAAAAYAAASAQFHGDFGRTA
ncbi:MAG: hypothetical protein B7Y69_09295 [Sphingobacteriia bacterium 35-40-8]|jgi:hypothetical protein|nr:MAG: hypothetical protein B7Y69_09295 [Sphingobacteriia bacterium 35-40-8]